MVLLLYVKMFMSSLLLNI